MKCATNEMVVNDHFVNRGIFLMQVVCSMRQLCIMLSARYSRT
jgi:hypothetical protein